MERVARRQRTGFAGAVRTAAATSTLPTPPPAAVPPLSGAPSGGRAPARASSAPPAPQVRVGLATGRGGHPAEQRAEAAHMVAGRHGQQGHHNRDHRGVRVAAAAVATAVVSVATRAHARGRVQTGTQAARRAGPVATSGLPSGPARTVPVVLRRGLRDRPPAAAAPTAAAVRRGRHVRRRWPGAVPVVRRGRGSGGRRRCRTPPTPSAASGGRTVARVVFRRGVRRRRPTR